MLLNHCKGEGSGSGSVNKRYSSQVVEQNRSVNWPEVKVFEGKMCLDDARGFHSGPQDVLLRGLVVRRPDPV